MSNLVNKVLQDLNNQPVLLRHKLEKSKRKHLLKILLIALILVLLISVASWLFFSESENENDVPQLVKQNPPAPKIVKNTEKNIAKNTENSVKIEPKITLKIDQNLPITEVLTLQNTNDIKNTKNTESTENLKNAEKNLANLVENLPNTPQNNEKNSEKNNEKNKNSNPNSTKNSKSNIDIKTDLIPQNAYDYFHLANEAIRQNKDQNAIKALRKSLEIAPNFHDARKLLIMQLYNNKQISEAAEVAKRGSDLYSSENPDWTIISARLSLEKGDVNQAKTILEKNAKNAANRIDYQMLMAYTNLQQKNFVQSRKYYRQAIRMQPRNAAAWFGLAQSLEQQNKINEANQAYQQALNIGNLLPDLREQAEQKISQILQNSQHKNTNTNTNTNTNNEKNNEIVKPAVNDSENVIKNENVENPKNNENVENTKNAENAENTENSEMPKLENIEGTILSM